MIVESKHIKHNFVYCGIETINRQCEESSCKMIDMIKEDRNKLYFYEVLALYYTFDGGEN